MNTAGNLICGQVAGEKADLVSKWFHASLLLRTTRSMNSSDVSTSKTPQAMEAVTPATLAILSAGEFVGIVADDPGKEIELRGFFARFVKKGWGKVEQEELPIVEEVDSTVLSDNYNRVVKRLMSWLKRRCCGFWMIRRRGGRVRRGSNGACVAQISSLNLP